jgi:hypothetical protein
MLMFFKCCNLWLWLPICHLIVIIHVEHSEGVICSLNPLLMFVSL